MKIKAVALVAFALLAISGSAAFAQGIANAGAGSGDGASWVGAGESCPAARPDAAPDRLRAPQA